MNEGRHTSGIYAVRVWSVTGSLVAEQVVTAVSGESVRLTLTLRVSRHAIVLSVRPHTVLTACGKSCQRVVRKYPESDVSTLRTMRHACHAA